MPVGNLHALETITLAVSLVALALLVLGALWLNRALSVLRQISRTLTAIDAVAVDLEDFARKDWRATRSLATALSLLLKSVNPMLADQFEDVMKRPEAATPNPRHLEEVAAGDGQREETRAPDPEDA